MANMWVLTEKKVDEIEKTFTNGSLVCPIMSGSHGYAICIKEACALSFKNRSGDWRCSLNKIAVTNTCISKDIV